jgi:hypothetical protein
MKNILSDNRIIKVFEGLAGSQNITIICLDQLFIIIRKPVKDAVCTALAACP